jgi:hypothetical protein
MLLSPGQGDQRGVAPAVCRNPFSLVKNEVNGDSKSTNERGPALFGSLGSSCPYKRLLSCLGCSGQPSPKYFFPHRALFQFMCNHCPATWAGSRAGPLVSESVSPVRIVCMRFATAGAKEKYSIGQEKSVK